MTPGLALSQARKEEPLGPLATLILGIAAFLAGADQTGVKA
jgi:hypothetical protein